MEKLSLKTKSTAEENTATLRTLFPSCVTETTNSTSGKIELRVDFDALRQELQEFIVDEGAERYRLDWPGKRAALLASNAPIAKTLRPSVGESIDFELTNNAVIEGDNLDALKLI